MLKSRLLVLLCVLLVACSSQSSEQQPLPTRAQLPTSVATAKPTQVLDPTLEITLAQPALQQVLEATAPANEPLVQNELVFNYENKVTMQVERFEWRDTAGRYTPAKGAYLIMFALLTNSDTRSRCVFARDIRLFLDGQEYTPQNAAMSEMQGEINPRRDYVGAVGGQCFDVNETVPTFAVFDIPATFENANLAFYGQGQSVSAVWFDRSNTIAYEPTSAPTEAPIATDTAIPTVTAIPSATITDTPTLSFTNTPVPTSTPVPPTNAAPEVFYVTASANARACPQITCEILFRFQLGDEVAVIGHENGDSVSGNIVWHKVAYSGQEIFIHSSLLSTTKPLLQQVQEPVQQQSAQQPVQQAPVSTVPPPQQSTAPQFTCDCSKTCPAMASCEEAYFQLNQCGCSRRDGDGDGVPCEDRCPGG